MVGRACRSSLGLVPSLYKRVTFMNQPEDEWVPRISCQACGASWEIGETINHSCKQHSGGGSQFSLGIAGAPGPSTKDLDPSGLPLTDVSITPVDGLKIFRGQLVDISSPWSAEREGEFTLMVSFDSQTHRRLVESLYGDPGKSGMVGAEFCLTIRTEAPLTT